MNRIEPELHARLCALALGEVDPAERIALEKELSQSAKLREEYAHLKSTIALVRELEAQPQQLSPSAREELQQALPKTTLQAPSRRWWNSNWTRLAAGLTIAAGGTALLMRLQSASIGPGAASLERAAPAAQAPYIEKSALVAGGAPAPAAPPGSPLPRLETLGDVSRKGDWDVSVANGAATDLGLLTATVERESLAVRFWETPHDELSYLSAGLRMQGESPRELFLRFWGDNPFEQTLLDPVSTFAADVDTASYTLARRLLVDGLVPPREQVRTEEFINYFPADVPAPTSDTLRISTDLTPSRFGSGDGKPRWMLRVVLRGREMLQHERKPLRLTFVIDCSGSMEREQRLELVKDALRMLISQLDSHDAAGLVAFSDSARQLAPMTPVTNKAKLEAAIDALQPSGWTNSEAGLRLGYETALEGLDARATNRVIFLSDGVANRGMTDPEELSKTVQPIRERGILLNTFGVGMTSHNDALLEQLADKGDGQCHYIDDLREARRVLVQRFMGTMETIARDVKLQVEFDPTQVERYRLLGYENRAIADADFRNDQVDAGEIGSGHQVTALYELERTFATSDRPLATVRARWKDPGRLPAGAKAPVRELAQLVSTSSAVPFETSSVGYRRAVLVAQFAEFLRRSVHARGDSFEDLMREAARIQQEAPQAEFLEFVALLERTRDLLARTLPPCDELCEAMEELKRGQYRLTELEALGAGRDQTLFEQLQRENKQQEEKVRALLERQRAAVR
jgi:Ca-activated chloride channel family protein